MNDQFVELCKKGDLTNIMEFCKKNDINDAFRESCRYGYLNIAQWLYLQNNIDIHSECEYAFRWTCDQGHLNVAQWLYSLSNINIHACYDDAFKSSCWNNHLDVAKWLYSLDSINIHGDTDCVFRLCCRYGYLNVIIWLLSIDKFNDNMVDSVLPKQLYEYAFGLGYLPINNDNMKTAYIEYKSKIKNEIEEKNENGNIGVFELSYLVDIIILYI